MIGRFLTVTLTLALVSQTHSSAGIITLDFLDPTGTGNTAGEAFESTGTFVESGVTFAVSVATTLGDETGSFSANTTSAGIDSDGISGVDGDAASELDAGETLTLTLAFSDLDIASVAFTSIDFDEVGSADGGDAALLNVADNGELTLETGATDFNGSTDVFTPAGGIPILSGQSIQISAQDNIELISASFLVATVPEPAHTALIVFAVAGLVAYRRRRRSVA